MSFPAGVYHILVTVYVSQRAAEPYPSPTIAIVIFRNLDCAACLSRGIKVVVLMIKTRVWSNITIILFDFS